MLNNWSLPNLGGEGRVAIRDLAAEGVMTSTVAQQFSDAGNRQSLAFDSTRASGDRNDDLSVAILTLDLSGLSDAWLTFHQFEIGDENSTLPDVHSLTGVGDGLAVSNDGVNWYRLKDILDRDINRGGDGLWQPHEYDLAAELARINGEQGTSLALTESFQIKFSQYANFPFPDDGWAIDNLNVFNTPQYLDPSLERGAFHRLDLPGENATDFLYRVSMFGDVDGDTPILVSVHGSGRSIFGHTQRWSRFVDDPANGVDDLIVVAPRFHDNERYNSYNHLAWNDANDAAADLVLLDVIDTLSSAGRGNGDQFYLWGFSAGGQFTQRFGLAHPDRLAASVVGGPGSFAQPIDDVPFAYGLGPHGSIPLPAGVTLDPASFLPSRIMFWVGQDDNDPSHFQLDSSGPATAQGEARLQRSANTFELMHRRAEQASLARTSYEYEWVVSEGDDHSYDQADYATWYEFLMRPVDENEQPLIVHSQIVLSPTADHRRAALPQTVNALEANTDYYLELWVEAPAGQASGVRTSDVEIYFDTTRADVVSLDHGSLFIDSTSGAIDEAAGRVRNFGGRTTQTTIGVSEFALLGRIQMRTANITTSPVQLAMAVQRGTTPFTLDNADTPRTDLLPVERMDVGAATSATVQGIVFHDQNGDGIQDSTEPHLTGREIRLLTSGGGQVRQALAIEPDAYQHGTPISHVLTQVSLSGVGTTVIRTAVTARVRDTSSTGTRVFNHMGPSGWNSFWLDDERELRMDFVHPTTSVSIDAVAKAGDPRDVAKLEIYNAADTLLDTYLTGDLADGSSETMTLTRAQGDIAYALAAGRNGHNVRLDNLQFTSDARAFTDEQGRYVLDQVPAGSYLIDLTNESDWVATSPSGGRHAIVLAVGETEAHRDFGSSNQLLEVAIVADEVSERGGSTSATVTRMFSDTSQALTVNLLSSDTGEAMVSASVVIPANQVSTTFAIDAVDDNVLDGTQTVNIIASASGFSARSDSVDILDDLEIALESGDLVAEIERLKSLAFSAGSNDYQPPTAANRSDFATMANSLLGGDVDDLSQPLTVTLASGDTSELSLPDSIQIPANQNSVDFTITGADDALLDGPMQVAILVSATG